MGELSTRTDVYNAIKDVNKVGVVHKYERHTDTWDAYLDLFRCEIDEVNLIRGWTLTCESWTQEQLTMGNAGTIAREYTYKIRGYFGLDDANQSELDAIAVVEDVIETLDADVDTDGSESGWNFPAELTTFEPRVYGDTLCHYAEVTLLITEFR